jgi:nucleotide-binding universal stress UspA family protein
MLKKIVVGTDGSEHGMRALRWAIDEADVHRADIEAVLAWNLLDQHHPDRSERFDPGYNADTAKATLAEWVTEVTGDATPVAQRVVCDLPARALLEASAAADLLVVGARGIGGFQGLLLGSVSERVAQLVARPIAVVRALAPVRSGRVMVGIDGSEPSREAVRWGAAEARARDVDLAVVHACRVPMIDTPRALSRDPGVRDVAGGGRALLDAVLADPALDGVQVHGYVTDGPPARVLLERAAGAGLLVVGTRGLGRVARILLGSVSRQLLHHAPCPVVVIP